MQKLNSLIPEDELKEKLNQYFCELDNHFLCFEKIYSAVASIVPHDKIIIDIGCYMGAQAYFFLDNPVYIGVDNYEAVISTAPKRFTTKNSVHIVSDAITWISHKRWEEITGSIDLNKMYVICSGMPNEGVRELIYDIFPNCIIFFPGMEIITKGIKSNELKELLVNKQNYNEKFMG